MARLCYNGLLLISEQATHFLGFTTSLEGVHVEYTLSPILPTSYRCKERKKTKETKRKVVQLVRKLRKQTSSRVPRVINSITFDLSTSCGGATEMDLNEEDENSNDGSRQLFLVGAPRDPLVSAGAIVTSVAGVSDDINQSDDLQSTALAGLIGAAQSTSVCFPTNFSKCTTLCVSFRI